MGELLKDTVAIKDTIVQMPIIFQKTRWYYNISKMRVMVLRWSNSDVTYEGAKPSACVKTYFGDIVVPKTYNVSSLLLLQNKVRLENILCLSI